MFLRRRLLSTAAAAARGPPPIRVDLTESAGRGVFATRPVSAGELLHSAQPLVCHPSPSLLHEVCYSCLRRKPGEARVSGGGHYFCGDACREHAKGFHDVVKNADWSSFDDHCSSRGLKYPYMAKRLACMVISGASNADCLNILQPARLHQGILIEMEEEFELLESTFRKAGFQEGVTTFLTKEWYINILARIRINAFRIELVASSYEDLLSSAAASVSCDASVGNAVYMLPSFYNHDCDPNTHIVWLDNVDAKLKALRDIEEGMEKCSYKRQESKQVVVPQHKFMQHKCRKGKTIQNVMASCDFDMCFTFVLARWPGSVHDMTVFDDAMSRYKDYFPKAPRGKFYLVDSGYANRPAFLTPYRQTMYHIQDFQNAVKQPRGMKETFNYAHSSLRNVIERAFGVLKMKWRILLEIPSYPEKTQTHIIWACMALHNFIRRQGQFDHDFGIVDSNMNYVPAEATLDQPETEAAPESDDMASMNAFRDRLAQRLYTRYNS